MASALSRGCVAQQLSATRFSSEPTVGRQPAAEARLLPAACLTRKSYKSCRPRYSALSSSKGQFTAAWCLPTLPLRRKDGHRGRKVSCAVSADRPASKPRFIQHKQEAFWFYRFLSIVYDHVINPGHWTEDMREDALEVADLNDPNLKVVDVGAGTGILFFLLPLICCFSCFRRI
jgi:methylase of polypeptide subunit release factors